MTPNPAFKRTATAVPVSAAHVELGVTNRPRASPAKRPALHCVITEPHTQVGVRSCLLPPNPPPTASAAAIKRLMRDTDSCNSLAIAVIAIPHSRYAIRDTRCATPRADPLFAAGNPATCWATCAAPSEHSPRCAARWAPAPACERRSLHWQGRPADANRFATTTLRLRLRVAGIWASGKT